MANFVILGLRPFVKGSKGTSHTRFDLEKSNKKIKTKFHRIAELMPLLFSNFGSRNKNALHAQNFKSFHTISTQKVLKQITPSGNNSAEFRNLDSYRYGFS
jgi:hypothetical protein